MLHVALVEPHPQTPTYLLTCATTWQRTVIDPLHPHTVLEALGTDKLDLILLTCMTELTLAGAEMLHHRTGAPILAAENVQQTALPVARLLRAGEVVGLGPLAQTIWLPEGEVMCYALGSEGVIFTGPLFATGVMAKKANKSALAMLKLLPEDTVACGGGAHNLPLAGLLTATAAS
jgi:hypothetical protein